VANVGRLGDGTDATIVAIRSGLFARRRFLGWGLFFALVGFGRRLWAQGARFLRYRPLSRPVFVQLSALAVPGRARRFVARGVSPPTAANPDQPVRVNGLVARVSSDDDSPESFKAVCAVCPHEQCEVDFIQDPKSLDPLVVQEIGEINEPVYLCPCHNSTFTMTEGERLSGPAPRGLYRFRVTAVTDAAVEIGEVEEDVLLFF